MTETLQQVKNTKFQTNEEVAFLQSNLNTWKNNQDLFESDENPAHEILQIYNNILITQCLVHLQDHLNIQV